MLSKALVDAAEFGNGVVGRIKCTLVIYISAQPTIDLCIQSKRRAKPPS